MDNFISRQDQDTPISVSEFPRAYVRYLYARSSDTRMHGSLGQDYLQWHYKKDALIFVICDGVSGSFYGNIAAERLGWYLLDELLSQKSYRLDHEIANASALKEFVTGELKKGGPLQFRVDQEVDQTEIPADLSKLQQEAILQLKQEHGSETVFACGRLTFGSVGMAPRLLLLWMGDTSIRLLDSRGQTIEFSEPGEWKSSDRWSSKHGLGKRGAQLHAWIGEVKQYDIDRILVWSDGLSAYANEIQSLQDHQLQQAVYDQLLSPTSDDISFLDIRLKSANFDETLAAPHVAGDSLCWTPIDGASQYEVQESANGVFFQDESYYHVYQVTTSAWPAWRSQLKSSAVFRHYRVLAQVGEKSYLTQTLRAFPKELADPEVVGISDAPGGSYIISWKRVPGAFCYLVNESRSKDQPDCQIAIADKGDSDVLTCTFNNREPGIYRYRVEACGPAGPKSNRREIIKTIEPGSSRSSGSLSRSLLPTNSSETDGVPMVKIVGPAAMKYSLSDEVNRADSLRQVPGGDEGVVKLKHLASPQIDPMNNVRVNEPYNVVWSPVPGATNYELEIAYTKSDAMAGNFLSLDQGSETLYSAAPVLEVGTRVYRVRALSKNGVNSSWSEWESIDILPGEGAAKSIEKNEPNTMSVVRTESSARAVLQRPELSDMQPVKSQQPYMVTWSTVPGARRYELQRLQQVDQSSEYVTIYEDQDPYFWEQQSGAGTYFYRVRAKLATHASESDWSDPKSVRVNWAYRPDAPKLHNIPTPIGSTSFKITWSPVPDADYYVLQQENQFGEYNDIPGATKILRTEYVISVKHRGTHKFRVAAVNLVGRGNFSSPKSVRVEYDPLPDAPILDEIRNRDRANKYLLNWRGYAWSYVLFEAQEKDFSDERRIYDNYLSYFTVANQLPGHYFYRVFSCNRDKQFDPLKPSNVVETTVDPEKPTKCDISCKDNINSAEVTIMWKKSKVKLKYEIQLNPPSASAPEWIEDNALTVRLPQGIYRVGIRACYGGICSDFSWMNIRVYMNAKNKYTAEIVR